MLEWISRIPMHMIIIMLASLIAFGLFAFLLYSCRRKRAWLTLLVMVTYGLGIVLPSIVGMAVFGVAIYHFHYQVPDPALFWLSVVGWLVMLGCIVGGIIWTFVAINKSPKRKTSQSPPSTATTVAQ